MVLAPLPIHLCAVQYLLYLVHPLVGVTTMTVLLILPIEESFSLLYLLEKRGWLQTVADWLKFDENCKKLDVKDLPEI